MYYEPQYIQYLKKCLLYRNLKVDDIPLLLSLMQTIVYIYADDLALFADSGKDGEILLQALEKSEKSIGLHINSK